MELVYTIEKGRVRIERVLEPDPIVEIPETMEGYPVEELAAYVLAESDVEELRLPPQIRKIGAYAFYRCEKLRSIYCYGRALDLGTGLFADARHVAFLDITLFEGEKSCLKELLSELRQTLRVRIHEKQETRLIFPEFYEDSVENTPARIVVVETHGCGPRYRYCFVKTQFQHRDYDELFAHVTVQEPEALVMELALGRLMYPCGLTESNERIYCEYVAEHWELAGRLLIEAHRLDPSRVTNLEAGRIPWLVEHPGIRDCLAAHMDPAEQLRAYTRLAQEAGDIETVSWLMDRQRPQGRKRRFEL